MAKDSFMCIATSKGISVSTNGGKSFSKMISSSVLDKSMIDVIEVSQKGIIYAGANEGLYISQDLGLTFKKASIPDVHVTSISFDKNGKLFVGTFGYDGLYVLNEDGNLINSPKNPLLSGVVRRVYIDERNIIYVLKDEGLFMSYDGGISFEKKSEINKACKWDIAVNQQGVIYVVTDSGIFFSIDGGKSFAPKRFRKYEDGYMTDDLCICIGSDGVVYIGNKSMGIFSLEENGTYTNTTMKSGLASNWISYIYFDSNEVMYVCTDKGLSISTDGGKTFENRKTIDGLSNNSIKHISIIQNPTFLISQYDTYDFLENEEDVDGSEEEDEIEIESIKKNTKVALNIRSASDRGLSGIEELNKLAGLDEIKNHVELLVSAIKGVQLRNKNGLNLPSEQNQVFGHYVFFGPPGTGKTTVARIMAKIFKEIGVLRSGHLIEATRVDLVSQYTGETAIKTRKLLKSALDGVLFIDEAYSLNQKGQGGSSEDNYGQEAINELLTFMENNRDRIIIIIAGYEKEIRRFIETNPGLKSRFKEEFRFENYHAQDLCKVLVSDLEKSNYLLQESAKEIALNLIQEAILSEGEKFGNLRFVRDLKEKTLRNTLARISKISSPTREDLRLIVEADFKSFR